MTCAECGAPETIYCVGCRRWLCGMCIGENDLTELHGKEDHHGTQDRILRGAG